MRGTIVAAAAALAVAAPAQAGTIDGPDTYRQYAEQAHAQNGVPLPTWVHVEVARCPVEVELRGCYEPWQRTIYLTPGTGESQRVFLHELGHAVDYQLFDDAERQGFRNAFGQRFAYDPWWSELGHSSPAEWLGEAYATCAMGALPDYSYGYAATPTEQAAACAVIRAAAADPVAVSQTPVTAVKRCHTVRKTVKRHYTHRVVRRHGKRVRIRVLVKRHVVKRRVCKYVVS